MAVMDFIENYKNFLRGFNSHETRVIEYIKSSAKFSGYEDYNGRRRKYMYGDKIIFEFKDKLIALVELGKNLEDGSNVIVSHMDAPRLDVIQGNPIEVNEDGVFIKTVPYGGIISQLYLDRPLKLVGRIYDDDGKLIKIDSSLKGYLFNVTSLLPHLKGRQEVKDLTYDKLKVRIGNNEEDNIFEIIKTEYNVSKENLEFAELSFVPYSEKILEMGFDKDLLMGYAHDDLCCTYANLQSILTSEPSNITKIALFVSYEETGSNQLTGAISQFIDDIYLKLAEGDILLARECITNTKLISADVCAGFDSTYTSHFETGAKAICGKGVTIVPILGNKRGNDSTIQMKQYIKTLCKDNEIDYQVEFTKPSEGGGGTVSSFFATRGMECIDVAIPVLAMHSPMECISKKDIFGAYELYKVFLESN